MERTHALFWQVFLGILVVSLGAVLAVGATTRVALSRAFDAYLRSLPQPGGGMQGGGRGMGRMMLGAAEQSFLSTVDRSVIVGAVVAVAVAAIAALVLARYLTRPLERLEHAAVALAAGELDQRVEPSGPVEVAALGRAFNTLADSLEEAEELRSRLVADVSHELRNPIAAARAQAEGMAEGVLVADGARMGSLVRDLEHLSRLVDDLQELSVADAGRLRYDMQRVDIGALARQEAERAAPSAAPGVEVRASGAPDTVVVSGDPRRLSQVLRNLLSNAVRHTERGRIEVTWALRDGSVEVRVSDTGPGIPAEDLPYVFERFYRADTARAAGTGGAGLGLAIARRIVRDHGGDVFAESAEGGGASVGFSLPVA